MFLNLMVGTILEVMSEEQNATQAKQAHDERARLSQRLDEVPATLNELLARMLDDQPRR